MKSAKKFGWYRYENSFDQDNNLIETHLLGKPELFQVHSYNPSGKLSELFCLNAKREPVNNPANVVGVDDPSGGWHKVTLLYDEKGRHTYDVYTKANGKEIARVDCSLKKCW